MFRKRDSDSIHSVSPRDLAEMDGADMLLVDTRPNGRERIPGTNAHIPYNQIDKRTEDLPADKDAAIGVYCVTGVWSTTAAKKLVKLGYTNVMNLAGGIEAWKKAGYEVEQDLLTR